LRVWALDFIGRAMKRFNALQNFVSGIMLMKIKTCLFVVSVICTATACSLLWSPTATVKKFMSAATKNDVHTMNNLFSKKAVARLGSDRIENNNQSFANMMSKAKREGNEYAIKNLTETTTPDGARVAFFYQSTKGNDSIRLVFDLSREDGAWKIDDIGGADKENPAGEPSPEASPSASLVEPPPPPPATNSGSTSAPASLAPKTPTSGGVLNQKAIELPQPSYPPVAKAAKASGQVTVQVSVDEQGNVISAVAVSGHPLLQAAAVAAARQAKFTPTKLSGQPVKVNGILIYNFVLPQ
jgi:TonB family protein